MDSNVVEGLAQSEPTSDDCTNHIGIFGYILRTQETFRVRTTRSTVLHNCAKSQAMQYSSSTNKTMTLLRASRVPYPQMETGV